MCGFNTIFFQNTSAVPLMAARWYAILYACPSTNAQRFWFQNRMMFRCSQLPADGQGKCKKFVVFVKALGIDNGKLLIILIQLSTIVVSLWRALKQINGTMIIMIQIAGYPACPRRTHRWGVNLLFLSFFSPIGFANSIISISWFCKNHWIRQNEGALLMLFCVRFLA